MESHPFLDPSFEIAWSQLTPEHIVPDMREAIRRAEAKIHDIATRDPAELSYENTFDAFDRVVSDVSEAWTKVSHLEGTMNTPAFRERFYEAQPLVTRFLSGLTFNEALWATLKTFGESPQAEALDPLHRRHVSEVMADFRESGADLPKDKKDRLLAIDEKLSRLTSDFQNNALDSLNSFEWILRDEAELAGLPPSAIEAAREDALNRKLGTPEAPVWRFTLHAPSFMPVMRFAEHVPLRKAMWEAFRKVASEAPHDNEPLILEILGLRHEKAGLLGKEHFADVVLERRMARNGAHAVDFVRDLQAKTQPAFQRECARLQAFKAEALGSDLQPLDPWELAYWSEKMQREVSGLDPEALRPYFSKDAVLAGLFQLSEELFGIEVKERTGPEKPEVWHPEVGFYDVRDRASGRHLGSFYTDWHPRDSKRSGAWLGPLHTGRSRPDGSLEPNLAVMCGNMSRPAGGKPALLSHDEVETIFHEFGHCLHHLLSEVPVPALAGLSVPWDFVELPSQLLENWCWDREGLDRFARHYETGEPLPESLFQQLLKTKTFQAALGQMRQLSFGLTDLALHIDYVRSAEKPDLEAWWRTLNAEMAIPTTVEPRSNLRNFGHLFSSPVGYAAGYYSYKWAEVLEADAFSRFQAEGIANPKTGMDFRKKVLARGNSVPPERLFEDFMGRAPDPEALLRRLGLIEA